MALLEGLSLIVTQMIEVNGTAEGRHKSMIKDTKIKEVEDVEEQKFLNFLLKYIALSSDAYIYKTIMALPLEFKQIEVERDEAILEKT